MNYISSTHDKNIFFKNLPQKWFNCQKFKVTDFKQLHFDDNFISLDLKKKIKDWVFLSVKLFVNDGEITQKNNLHDEKQTLNTKSGILWLFWGPTLTHQLKIFAPVTPNLLLIPNSPSK